MKCIIKKSLLIFTILIFDKITLYSEDFKKIKILINESKQISIILNGKFQLFDTDTEKDIASIENNEIKFYLADNKIKIENYGLFSGTLHIRNISDGIVLFNNYKYRGDFYIISATNKIMLINELPVEEYLKGVLPNEISPSWHKESIKAQAVAARTFAYFHKIKNAGQSYHLNGDTLSQVYTGQTGKAEIFNSCIKETEDEVLEYKGKIIPTYFHSACGGHTEDAGDVWGTQLPYLKGVPCKYCKNAPYYEWEAHFAEDEIIRKLVNSRYNIANIKAIVPEKISSSGRWTKVKIIGSRTNISLPANSFRLIMGSEKLRSTKFRVYHNKDNWIFKGNGWGHGVGLCQWGARGMADKGYKYYQILRYYFRGARLVKISSKYLSSSTQKSE